MNYNLFYKNTICGEVLVEKEEVYTNFFVQSSIISLNITKVFMKNDENLTSLGILMPKHNSYILEKKIHNAKLKDYIFDEKLNFYIEVQGEVDVLDKNLSKILGKNVIKKEFKDFDLYLFEFFEDSPFLFDFCFTLCKIIKDNNKIYFAIKTDKRGKILV